MINPTRSGNGERRQADLWRWHGPASPFAAACKRGLNPIPANRHPSSAVYTRGVSTTKRDTHLVDSGLAGAASSRFSAFVAVIECSNIARLSNST